MSFPLTYGNAGALRTEQPAPEPGADAMDTGRPPGASDEELLTHPVTEAILNEMGRALADRLNALVDKLDKQH
jgi:hypothetical protein